MKPRKAFASCEKGDVIYRVSFTHEEGQRVLQPGDYVVPVWIIDARPDLSGMFPQEYIGKPVRINWLDEEEWTLFRVIAYDYPNRRIRLMGLSDGVHLHEGNRFWVSMDLIGTIKPAAGN